jgi:hypothetical protein
MIHGYCSPSSALIVIAALAAAPELLMAQATRDLAMPERVQFGSADGKTTLVGYRKFQTIRGKCTDARCAEL